MPIGRETNYRDLVEPFTADDVDFTDPLERAAIAAQRMTFTSPAEASSLFAPSQQAELAYTWTRIEATMRQLWRKRAAVILAAHAGEAGQ